MSGLAKLARWLAGTGRDLEAAPLYALRETLRTGNEHALTTGLPRTRPPRLLRGDTRGVAGQVNPYEPAASWLDFHTHPADAATALPSGLDLRHWHRIAREAAPNDLRLGVARPPGDVFLLRLRSARPEFNRDLIEELADAAYNSGLRFNRLSARQAGSWLRAAEEVGPEFRKNVIMSAPWFRVAPQLRGVELDYSLPDRQLELVEDYLRRTRFKRGGLTALRSV